MKTIVVSNRSVAGSIPAVGAKKPHTNVWGFSCLKGIIDFDSNIILAVHQKILPKEFRYEKMQKM